MAGFNENYEELTLNWTKAQPVVSAFILSVVPNAQHAEDILQEVALVIVRKYDTYVKGSSFVAWAIGIAKNECLRHRRKHARDRHVFDDELVLQIAALCQTRNDDMFEMKAALSVCISKLPSHGQKLLEMQYAWGLEIKKIAGQMGMTANAAFVALHRIRMSLQDCIRRQLNMLG
jgi:RNA polymerase sigma-70 factor (ECF subfamily)